MLGKNIQLIISDFDGTLVDTFTANFCAYQEAFRRCHLILTESVYRSCFGLRFTEFMERAGVYGEEHRLRIQQLKRELYPNYFDHFTINISLLNLLRAFHQSGGKTAIASTAKRGNLMNALSHIQGIDIFDLIISGEDVKRGKPDPEVYEKALAFFQVDASEALVFEDSLVGMRAAESAGICYIQVNQKFYGNRG